MLGLHSRRDEVSAAPLFGDNYMDTIIRFFFIKLKPKGRIFLGGFTEKQHATAARTTSASSVKVHGAPASHAAKYRKWKKCHVQVVLVWALLILCFSGLYLLRFEHNLGIVGNPCGATEVPTIFVEKKKMEFSEL